MSHPWGHSTTVFTHRTHYGRLPLEHVVACRASAARRGWVTSEVNQFLRRSLGWRLSKGKAREGVTTLLMRLRAMGVKSKDTGESVRAVQLNRGEIEHHRTRSTGRKEE
jgi:hypothetical protein